MVHSFFSDHLLNQGGFMLMAFEKSHTLGFSLGSGSQKAYESFEFQGEKKYADLMPLLHKTTMISKNFHCNCYLCSKKASS
jgi:hypothetical protein